MIAVLNRLFFCFLSTDLQPPCVRCNHYLTTYIARIILNSDSLMLCRVDLVT